MVKYLSILLLFPAIAIGAPSISSISGTIENDGNFTISGTSFLTGPTIDLYDNFDGGTNETNIPAVNNGGSEAIVGDWDTYFGGDTADDRVWYSNSYYRSGSMAMKVTAGYGATGLSPRIIHNFDNPSTQFFATYWVYHPSEDEWPIEYYDPDWLAGVKFFWVLAGCSHFQSDIIFPSYNSVNNSGSEPIDTWDPLGTCDYFGNNVGSMDPADCTPMYSGIWYRHDFYWVGSNAGAGVLYARRLAAGSTATVEANLTGLTNADAAENYTCVEFGHWSRSHPDVLTRMYFDDVYLAAGSNCRARVEVGNNSTYSSCTNLSICTINSWSGTSINATLRQGSFSSGTAYIFVIDSNNDASSGYEVTIGAASGESTFTGTSFPSGGVSCCTQ